MRRFLLFLARTAFHKPVSEFENSLTSSDLTEWMAEYQLSPWGNESEENSLMLGQVCATIANVHRTKKDQKMSAQDFVPKSKKNSKKQTLEQQYQLFKAITS